MKADCSRSGRRLRRGNFREGERERRAGIEGIIRIVGIAGDYVAEIFVEKLIVGLDAGFEFVVALVDGDGGVEVSLSEIVVLETP